MKATNKTFNLTALATALLTTTLLVTPLAEAKPRHFGGGPNAEEGSGPSMAGKRHGRGGLDQGSRIEAMFNRIDADDDLLITLAELTDPAVAKAENKLAKKDTDADGVLSLEEFLQRRHQRPDLTEIADELVQCVEDIKTETGNENIQVPSVDDFTTPEEKFAALDTSADGFLDLSELEASATDKAANKMANMDADASGDVTLEEFTAAVTVHHTTKKVIHQCARELSDDILG